MIGLNLPHSGLFRLTALLGAAPTERGFSLTDALPYEAWIILTGALAGAACGTIGCYLLLRRLSLLGDAISHAVLPGIVFAFFVAGSRAVLPILIGAAATGLLASFFIETLERGGTLQKDAAIGVTFTALFSLGVLMIALKGDAVDLDQACVLYGEIGMIHFDVLEMTWGGRLIDLGPRAFVGLLLAFGLVVAFIAALWKELLVSSFDPALARATGIPATLIHYLLMAVVSVTVVASFESVGSILVVALLVVPGATAYLLTDRFGWMLVISCVVAVISSLGGFYLSRAASCSISGAMTVVLGAQFTLAFLAAPRQGLVTRAITRRLLRLRIGAENLLGELARATEREEAVPGLAAVAQRLGWSGGFARSVARYTERRGLTEREAGGSIRLLAKGLDEAMRVRSTHRAWQDELVNLGYDHDHAHSSAHRLEHVASPAAVRAERGRSAEPPEGLGGKGDRT
ncbi:MAG: metal ABC transporter permease [Planctomycetota bacterium]|jgi:manganese/zinc/iron transport system permease protein